MPVSLLVHAVAHCVRTSSAAAFDLGTLALLAVRSNNLWFAKNACGPNARVSISIATGFGRPGEAECGARNVCVTWQSAGTLNVLLNLIRFVR
jgi:hypothetical protein